MLALVEARFVARKRNEVRMFEAVDLRRSEAIRLRSAREEYVVAV